MKAADRLEVDYLEAAECTEKPVVGLVVLVDFELERGELKFADQTVEIGRHEAEL